MKQIIVIVLIVAALGIAANDIARAASAQKHLGEVTYTVTKQAGDLAAQGKSREQAGGQIATAAQQQGVTVYQYGQTDRVVQVWTMQNVDGTIVAGTVAAMLDGEPVGTALGSPLVLKDYREATFQ